MNIKSGSIKKKGNLGLSVTPPDLQKILMLVSDVQRADNDAEKGYIVKKNLLSIVRYLIRNQGIFDIVRKELDFYMKLLSWCRSEPNATFNREAWHLFYKVIQYHTGVFDFLKGNILEKFLETIGTASPPIVVENGLRWLNKIFNLPAEEQKLLQIGKASRIDKDPLKVVEKDLKTLGQFYVAHTLFIKVHMIYKNLGPKCAGPSFMQLVRFYYSLCNQKYNDKVLKEIVKKDDYKIGIIQLNGMFMGVDEQGPGPVKKKKEDKPKDVNSPKDKQSDAGNLTLRKPVRALYVSTDKF